MLLLIAGASGVGKSTARQLIEGRLDDRIEAVELVDLAPVPETQDVRWRQQTAEKAARRALKLQRGGRHLLLAGDPVVPGEILVVPSARDLDIAICLLDADEPSQISRLRQRGDDEDLLTHHVAFADWLRRHVHNPRHMLQVITVDCWESMRWEHLRTLRPDDPRWQIPTIDTSSLSKTELADRALRWTAAALEGNVPTFRAGWHDAT